jgi:hypothetical protein
MSEKPKRKLARTVLTCQQCQSAIPLFGKSEQLEAAFTPSLCAACCSSVYDTCTPFILIREPGMRTIPRSKLHAARDPKEIQAAKIIGEEIVKRLGVWARGGSEFAALRLAELTFACVIQLQDLAEWHPELLRPMARQMIEWPFFVGKKSWYRKHGHEIMRKLQLGVESPYRGKWHPEAPATLTAVAISHWLYMNAAALRLPPLTLAALPVWFEVGWRRLLVEAKGRPDEIPYLTRIGQSAAKKKSTTRYMPELTAGMQQDDVIAKIKEIVKKSFFNLHGHPAH